MLQNPEWFSIDEEAAAAAEAALAAEVEAVEQPVDPDAIPEEPAE